MNSADKFIGKIGHTTLSLILGVIMVLNIGSWLVGAIWLAIIGEWGLLLYGLGLSIVMPYAYSFALIPTMLVMTWMSHAIEKNQKTLAKVLIIVSTIYQYAILMFWVLYVFEWSLGYYPEVNMIPLILYGYATMTGPLTYMGQKEGPNATGTYMAIFIAEVAYLLILVLTLLGFSRGSINNLLWIGIIGFAIYMGNLLMPAIASMTSDTKDVETDQIEEGIIVEADVCEHCGADIKKTSKFCSRCGNKLHRGGAI